MKNLLLTLLVASALFSFKPITKINSTPKAHKVENKVACNYGQCQATAKSTGNQCKHCVSKSGDRYCFQHK
jgi:hypothetical protein